MFRLSQDPPLPGEVAPQATEGCRAQSPAGLTAAHIAAVLQHSQWVTLPRMSSNNLIPDLRPRPRHNGWTPERQQRFLEHLAMHGSVSAAARHAGISKQSAYWFRRQPYAQDFAAAWDAALADSGRWIEDMAMDRLLDGEEEVIERDGEVVAVRRRPADVRLLLFHLKRLEDRRAAHRRLREAAMLQRMQARAQEARRPPDSASVEKLRAELRALAAEPAAPGQAISDAG